MCFHVWLFYDAVLTAVTSPCRQLLPISCLPYSSVLKTEAILSSETSDFLPRRYNPEDRPTVTTVRSSDPIELFIVYCYGYCIIMRLNRDRFNSRARVLDCSTVFGRYYIEITSQAAAVTTQVLFPMIRPFANEIYSSRKYSSCASLGVDLIIININDNCKSERRVHTAALRLICVWQRGGEMN